VVFGRKVVVAGQFSAIGVSGLSGAPALIVFLAKSLSVSGGCAKEKGAWRASSF
jgi:hypothetical protein